MRNRSTTLTYRTIGILIIASIVSVFVVCCLAHAQVDVLPDTTSDQSTVVLNDNLQRLDARNRTLQSQLTAILPIDLSLYGTAVKNQLSIEGGGTGATTAQAAIDALTNVAGATNEYVLTKDTATGSAVFKSSGRIFYGDSSLTALIGEANTERKTSSSSYVMLKEFVVVGSGILTVAWDSKSSRTDSSNSVVVYRNGSMIGTEKTFTGVGSDSYATFSDTITGWSSGDLLQIYAKRTTGIIYVKNAKIYGTTFIVNTD